MVSGLLCILAAALADDAAPRLDVPRGFAASVYASGIDGARDLELRTDGTLTLQGGDGRFEISPPTADEPVTVMQVAPELDAPRRVEERSLAVQAPAFVRMRWDAGSGELAYAMPSPDVFGIRVAPQTVALARALSHRHDADVELAPDGTLFVADSRAGTIWRVRRSVL